MFSGLAFQRFSKVAEISRSLVIDRSISGVGSPMKNVLDHLLPAMADNDFAISLSLLLTIGPATRVADGREGGGRGTGHASGVPFADHSQYIPVSPSTLNSEGSSASIWPCQFSCHSMVIARTPDETLTLRLDTQLLAGTFEGQGPAFGMSLPVPCSVRSSLPPAAVVTGRSASNAPISDGEESTIVGLAV